MRTWILSLAVGVLVLGCGNDKKNLDGGTRADGSVVKADGSSTQKDGTAGGGDSTSGTCSGSTESCKVTDGICMDYTAARTTLDGLKSGCTQGGGTWNAAPCAKADLGSCKANLPSLCQVTNHYKVGGLTADQAKATCVTGTWSTP